MSRPTKRSDKIFWPSGIWWVPVAAWWAGALLFYVLWLHHGIINLPQHACVRRLTPHLSELDATCYQTLRMQFSVIQLRHTWLLMMLAGVVLPMLAQAVLRGWLRHRRRLRYPARD